MTWIAVLGGGSWGTTLANHLVKNGRPVVLWVRDPCLETTIRGRRENPVYLPGITLDERLSTTSDMKEALIGAEIVVCAVPSHGIREVFVSASRYLNDARI
ncbi:MAG: NAD(P)-binding domain-containing protein, partial [Deltaproteobacteria bacterium]|nr:NAD(P)-binding domain-containing protein [Deltaproteobacteria bacterium]